MSILNRPFGGASPGDKRCCDTQIDGIDTAEADERSPDERVDRAEG
jgi:hypothetical protein